MAARCVGEEEGGDWYRVSFWGDENVLKVNRDNGYMKCECIKCN